MTSTCFERERVYSSFPRSKGLFTVGLLAYYDEEPKRLPKFGGLVCISATRCRKIGGAESLEEIR